MDGLNIGVLADHIAAEAVTRLLAGEALGRPSLHNIIREAAIDAIRDAQIQEIDVGADA